MYFVDPLTFERFEERAEAFLATVPYPGDSGVEHLVRLINDLPYAAMLWSCESHPENDGSRPIALSDYSTFQLIFALKECPESVNFLDRFNRMHSTAILTLCRLAVLDTPDDDRQTCWAIERELGSIPDKEWWISTMETVLKISIDFEKELIPVC